MTKNSLGDSYLPLVQYAIEDSDGHIHRKMWKVLQGPYGNYLYTKEQYQMVVDWCEKLAAEGSLLKAKDNPFRPEEIRSWLNAGFAHACVLDEYMEVGNDLRAYLGGKQIHIYQEYQLQKYIRERTEYDHLDFGFWNFDFHTPTSHRKAKASKVAERVVPAEYYVLASNCGYWKDYFCRQLKSGIRKASSRTDKDVKKFKTENEALKYLASNRERIKDGYYHWLPLLVQTQN